MKNIGYSYTRTLYCESKNKMKQNYLDGEAFGIVLLQTKHAGTTVLYMQLLRDDISSRTGLLKSSGKIFNLIKMYY